MRRFGFLTLASLVVASLAFFVASNMPAKAFKGLDLRQLPGCAEQCHVKGGFSVDRNTGRKIMLGGGGGGGAQCKTRNACGPVLCERQQTCCDNNGNCTTKNLGHFPNPN